MRLAEAFLQLGRLDDARRSVISRHLPPSRAVSLHACIRQLDRLDDARREAAVLARTVQANSAQANSGKGLSAEAKGQAVAYLRQRLDACT